MQIHTLISQHSLRGDIDWPRSQRLSPNCNLFYYEGHIYIFQTRVTEVLDYLSTASYFSCHYACSPVLMALHSGLKLLISIMVCPTIFHLLTLSRVLRAWSLEPVPWRAGYRAGDTLDRMPLHRRGRTHTLQEAPRCQIHRAAGLGTAEGSWSGDLAGHGERAGCTSRG